MKTPSNLSKDIERLEKKINLLNDKLDRLMEAQGIALKRTEEVAQEEEKKRKVWERQQAKILQDQNMKDRIDRIGSDFRLKIEVGSELRRQFNLVTRPSASRIREYQRTGNESAFKGLKRNS